MDDQHQGDRSVQDQLDDLAAKVTANKASIDDLKVNAEIERARNDEREIVAEVYRTKADERSIREESHRVRSEAREIRAEAERVRGEVRESRAEALRQRVERLEEQTAFDREVLEQLKGDSEFLKKHSMQMEEALRSSRRIGAAIGIIMANMKVTEQDAFIILRDASQAINRKVHDIADEIVLTGDVSCLLEQAKQRARKKTGA